MATVRHTVFTGEALALNDSGIIRDIVPDLLYSNCALLDTFQMKTDEFTYWPYGEVRSSSGALATAIKYQGAAGYYASVSGILYVRARYYDPLSANWWSRDPEWPAQRPYAYANLSPVTGLDPTGTNPARVGDCAVYVCRQYGYNNNVVTHKYLCVTGPNGGCAGGLYPGSGSPGYKGMPGKDNPIGGPGSVRDEDKACKTRKGNPKMGEYPIHCEEVTADVPTANKCDIAAAFCECVRTFRKEPPRYEGLHVCWAFPATVGHCAQDRVYGSNKNFIANMLAFRL